MEFLTSGPLASGWATFLVLVVLGGLAWFGGWILALVGYAPEVGPANARVETELTPGEFWLFGAASGLFFFSSAILLLGTFGFLTKTSALLLVLGLYLAPFLVRTEVMVFPAVSRFFFKPHVLFTVCFGAALLLSWVSALAPPTGTDSLSYHLTHPKLFILNKGISYLEGTRESLWPYLTEMLFTFGLRVEGTTLATLFHWIFYGLTAAAVYLFGCRFFDESSGKLAALIFLFTPAAFAQAGHAYVDLSLAFFVFLGAYAFLVYVRTGAARFAFLAGALCGAAAGVKFLGLGACALLGVLTFFPKGPRVKACFLFLLGACLAGGFWYLRSWWVLGNPVYPFFPEFFAGHGFHSDIAEEGMGRGVTAFLVLFWNLTFYPNSFGGEILGPFYLMFLPLLLFTLKDFKAIYVYILIFAAAYAGFIFTQSQQARFFLSVAPLLAMGAGAAVRKLRAVEGKALKGAARLFFISVLALHAGIFVYRTRDAWGVALGRTGAVEYLATHERSFKGYQFLESRVKTGEKVLNSAEPKYFYGSLRGMVINAPSLRRSLDKVGMTLTQYLDEQKFDYIWLLHGFNPELFGYVRSRGYEEIYHYEFVEKPVTFRYSIWARR